MAVQDQTPIIEYIANGSTNIFPITFDIHSTEDLGVLINGELVSETSYQVQDKSVVFIVIPSSGSAVTLFRDTEKNRLTDYKSYDNSLRPSAINWDLDKLWYVLQEQNLVDAKILARLKTEIEWRRTHDFNYDELAQVREKQIFDSLLGYTNTLFTSTTPNVFEGVTAGVVFALDKKSVQTHLNEIAANLEEIRLNLQNTIASEESRAIGAEENLNSKITNESSRAQAAEDSLLIQLNAVGVGNKAYKTYALMDADKTSIPAKSKVTVTNDATDSNNGDWQWDGVAFTKSAYDPLIQTKEYVKERVEQIGEGFVFKDKLGFTVFKIHSVDGVLTLESPFFKLDEISDILTVKDGYGFKFNLFDYLKNIEKSIQDIPNQGSSSIDIVASLQAKANAIMQSHLKSYRHPCATIKKGLNIIVVGGQSFSLGAQAGTIVTREPSQRGNLMLGGSPRGKHGELVDTNYTFDPFGGNVYQLLQECGQTKDGVIVDLNTRAGYYGETISSGLVESLKDYWNREHGVINDPDVTFAISCCGTGGATHDQLKKSTNTYYNRFLTCLDGHVEAAALAGYTDVQVAAIVYLHGQSVLGATKATYKANLAEMRNDMIADIKSKFGQSDDPAFFIHQIGGDYPASVSTQMGTSQAQLEFASETEGVFICDNEFGYPTPGAHLYPNGYRWMGCRFAKRMYPVLRDKQTVPFKIIDAVHKDDEIYIAFSSPTALKTRTVYKGVTAINDQTMGFTVRNSNGAVTISNAEIISESVVKLTLAQAQSTPLTLWLGSSYNNAVHNLCDSTAEKSIFNYVYDGTMQQSSAENIAEYVGKSYLLNEKPAVQFINIRSI